MKETTWWQKYGCFVILPISILVLVLFSIAAEGMTYNPTKTYSSMKELSVVLLCFAWLGVALLYSFVCLKRLLDMLVKKIQDIYASREEKKCKTSSQPINLDEEKAKAASKEIMTHINRISAAATMDYKAEQKWKNLLVETKQIKVIQAEITTDTEMLYKAFYKSIVYGNRLHNHNRLEKKDPVFVPDPVTGKVNAVIEYVTYELADGVSESEYNAALQAYEELYAKHEAEGLHVLPE